MTDTASLMTETRSSSRLHPDDTFSRNLVEDLSSKENYDLESGPNIPSSLEKTDDVDFSDEDDFPDGGLRAWLVVLGSACSTFATFGFVNAWGVFQAYYQRTYLSHLPPSTIAWVGSVQYCLVFLPGLVIGRLFDMGYFRGYFVCGSLLLVVATMLTAQCTAYWQILLCQGFGIGLSSGVVFGPTIAILGHWWKKRLSFVVGLSATGSAIGGTIIPIAARNLIQDVGFPWTMRIIGFILLFVLGIGNLTMRRRLPPKQNKHQTFISLQDFKNPAYSVYTLGGFVGFLGIYTVQTYLDISALSMGINSNLAFYLLSISNVGSGMGRLLAAYTSGKIGTVNTIMPATVVAGVITIVWPFVITKGGLITLAIFYGFSSGAFVSLLPAPVAAMGGAYDVGRRVGTMLTIVAFGALAGPPISGALNTATGGYKATGYYAGGCIMLSVVLLLIARHLILRKMWGKF